MLITHDMAEADSLADRVAVIDHGRLLALGTPEALKADAEAATLEAVFFHLTGKELRDR
ncbi:hypothetical protein ACU686_08485 [Yinghuangia aomiensis]